MRKVILIMMNLFLIAGLFGCGKTSGDVYAEPTGMKTITDIPGISFAIPNMVAQATAITAINNDMEFPSDSTFAYKDGAEKYILFNMDNIVILVEKNTHFGFENISDDEKVSGLSNSPIIGTWMSQYGKKFEYSVAMDDSSYKLIADVTAGVTITTDIFDDFRGKLAVITDGTTEYAMFIGTPIAVYEQIGKDGQELISLAAKSLRLYNAPEATPVEYDFDTEETAQEDVEKEVDTEEVTDDETVAEEPQITDEEATESVEEPSIVEEDPEQEGQSDTEDTTQDAVVASEETLEESIEEPQAESVDKVDDTTTQEEPVDESAGIAGMHLSNQRKNIPTPNMFVESDIYSTLRVGEGGILDALKTRGQTAEVKFNITEIYSGKEVNDLLIEYGRTDGATYGLYSPPTGCRWDAIVYTVDGDSDAYVNIKFRGLDGEMMYWNGVGYPKHTHDLSYRVTSEGTKRIGLICYYAVPANCYDYLLEVGEGTVSNPLRSAYYRITDEDISTETKKREEAREKETNAAESIANAIMEKVHENNE